MTLPLDRPAIASATLTTLAEVVGVHAALAISQRFGGRRLYVPHDAPETNPIVQLLGREVVTKLAKRYGGTNIDVPIGAGKKMEIVLLRLVEKLSHAEIASIVRATERHVYQVLADHDRAPMFDLPPFTTRDRHQGDLFGGFADGEESAAQ